MLVSLPPVGTRPSALAEREKVLRFAGRLGLDLVEVRTLAIAYDTPFFETNALSAAGVFAPSRWRRGDLVVLRKSRRSARLSSGASGRRREWVEVLIGRMRLFIRADRSASGAAEAHTARIWRHLALGEFGGTRGGGQHRCGRRAIECSGPTTPSW